MATVLLTSVGGLPQVSVIKHLRTLEEVTRILGYDAGEYFGATRALLDDVVYSLTPAEKPDVTLVCGDWDAISLNPDLEWVCEKDAFLRGCYRLGIPAPTLMWDAWEKPVYGSGSRGGHHNIGRLFTEYLPGPDWSVDMFCRDNGNQHAIVCRRRLRTKGASVHGVVEQNNKVIYEAARVSYAFGIPGLINVQMKEDAQGQPKVYEVNPRISGSIMLSVYAGVDLLRMEIRRQLGLSLEGLNTIPRDGATMHRYYSEAFSG